MGNYKKIEEAQDLKREQEYREQRQALFPFYFALSVGFLLASLVVEHGQAELILFGLGVVSVTRLF